jgi:hypothetical protein
MLLEVGNLLLLSFPSVNEMFNALKCKLEDKINLMTPIHSSKRIYYFLERNENNKYSKRIYCTCSSIVKCLITLRKCFAIVLRNILLDY